MSFCWIFANASQILSTLDGYEKLADEIEAISNGLKHVPATILGICTCLIGEMVKKASKRLYFLIGNKSTLMSRRPNCLGFTQALLGLFAITRSLCFTLLLLNQRFGSLHHMPHLALRQRSTFVRPRIVTSGSSLAPVSVPLR